MALVTVALAFASNFLLIRIAESEFNSAQQTMQTLGLQVDDVAWIIGRTETVRYSSRYGGVSFEPALKYAIYVNGAAEPSWEFNTGIVCFNMPVSQHSLGNDYFRLVYPSSDDGFLFAGASSPVARVFEVEKLPMADGSFVRVVVAPTIRMLNLSIGGTRYVRLYLPILNVTSSSGNSQSITLTGESVETKTIEGVTSIRVEASFPEALSGFDSSFFSFDPNPVVFSLAGSAVLEVYLGGVDVAFGVHA